MESNKTHVIPLNIFIIAKYHYVKVANYEVIF